MKETTVKTSACMVRVVTLNTVVVGSGAAGFNAADRLYAFGQTDLALVTEHINAGTSRNTGSDKQTYYKLTLSGGDADSVREMAQTLFEGQCVDGDVALCEAALSAQCFLKLVELGVPFPKNRYGEYIGYKTDHDPRRRATSVGPYTSKRMTECLEQAVLAKGIRIFDKMQVIGVLSDGKKAYGLLCLDLENANDMDRRFVAFCCKNIIYATGGPAGMYADSVFPAGHFGASGLAFEAGVVGKNLTEWQYGLASTKPRWNVSGTYMQVLPKFVSTLPDGSDAQEFLFDFFTDKGDLLTKVFLKGYQWPFDVRKIDGGSSMIDILVYLETCKGRKVYLDFRENPRGESIDYTALSKEAREYLEKAQACFGTPLERLLHMNAPAVEFYRDKGVDLATQPLEIALCAQHNNGGLGIDCWWHTNVEGFFAAGEVSASHGVYRPGGTALNAGQVGSTRAAQFVALRRTGQPDSGNAFLALLEAQAAAAATLASNALTAGHQPNVQQRWDAAAQRMSQTGAAVRNGDGIVATVKAIEQELAAYSDQIKAQGVQELRKVFRLRDILISQYVYLCAMVDYMQQGGKSRGSALYTDVNGKKPYDSLPDALSFTLDDGTRSDTVQEVCYAQGKCSFDWRKVRDIPEDDDFFENVWRAYREHANVF